MCHDMDNISVFSLQYLSIIVNKITRLYPRYVNYKQKNCIIFENLNIHFPDYGLIAITGESGCGKSTLLLLIAGLDQDYEGKILFNQVKIEDIKDYRQLVISFVYQNYQLIDYLSKR